jgi:hypothetical protein
LSVANLAILDTSVYIGNLRSGRFKQEILDPKARTVSYRSGLFVEATELAFAVDLSLPDRQRSKPMNQYGYSWYQIGAVRRQRLI